MSVKHVTGSVLGGLLAVCAAQAQFTYITNDSGITITGYTGTNSAVIIPSTIDGLPVTVIGSIAFYNNQNITAVTIPDTVTSIEGGTLPYVNYGAFCRTSLTNVAIPNSVRTIGNNAFAESSLNCVSIGAGLTNLGNFAFADCSSLTNVYFNGDAPLLVSDPAFFGLPTQFFGCPVNMIYYRAGTRGWSESFANVPVVAFGASGGVAVNAFPSTNMAPLTEVFFDSVLIDNFGNLITNWNWNFGDGAFSTARNPSHAYTNAGTYYPLLLATNSLGAPVPGFGPTSITVVNPGAVFTGVTNLGGFLITGYTGSGVDFTIPSEINGLPATAIASNAFAGTAIANVILPANIISIGADAFQGSALTNISIGSGVLSIGTNAFLGCPLQSINVVPGNVVYNSLDGVLFNHDFSALLAFPIARGGSFSIPNTVGEIAPYTFFGCSNLTSLIVPDSITNIGDYAFYGCGGLSNLTFGSGLVRIGAYAFSGPPMNPTGGTGPGPISVSFGGPPGSGPTTPGFVRGCPLGSLAIPDSVTSIGDYAFYDCVSLTNLTLGGGLASIGDFAFSGNAVESITLPNGLSSIGDYTFWGCPSLTNLVMGAGLIKIGAYVFGGTALGSVVLPASLTTIGEAPFFGCSSLGAISVAPGNPAYRSVAGVLFNQNQTTLLECPPGIGSYRIPDSVTTIGAEAFADGSITNVGFPSGLTDIESNAFSGCGLTSIVIPDSVTNIGYEAFCDCGALTNVSFGPNLITIGDYAFSGTGGGRYGLSPSWIYTYPLGCPLTSVTIPPSLTSIGTGAFEGCSSLTSVNILDSATTVGDQAFSWCSALTNINLGDRVTSIGASAFSGTQNAITSIRGFPFSLPSECRLTTLTIPGTVTNIAASAFQDCDLLTNIYFLGDAPSLGSNVFAGDNLTGYYLPWTAGWAQFVTNSGIASAPWLPQVKAAGPNFQAQTNQFGFIISWAPSLTVVVQAASDLSNPVWVPIWTNSLSGAGTSSFSDSRWTNYPTRFYRLRSL